MQKDGNCQVFNRCSWRDGQPIRQKHVPWQRF